jgi:hypothetical protein
MKNNDFLWKKMIDFYLNISYYNNKRSDDNVYRGKI